MSRLVCAPITRDAARAWVRQHHKHLPPTVGWLFGVSVRLDGDVCCVGELGRPLSRRLHDGETAEVTRVATSRTTPVPHAASKAIAALTRAALALGYTRLVSYTREDERGTSYRAAGWHPTAISRGGEWSCPSRPRAAAAQPCRKVRWEYGPRAAPAIDVTLPLTPQQATHSLEVTA